MLTHDREQAARYDSDPLIFRPIAVNVLLDLHDTSKRLLADAGAIQTPTLMIGVGKDWVVSLKAQQKFFDRQPISMPRLNHGKFQSSASEPANFALRVFKHSCS